MARWLRVEGNSCAATEVAAALATGETAIFPTDTVYGVGCALENRGGVVRLFDIKGRPAGKPIAVLLAGPEQVARLARVPGALAELTHSVIARYWPGGLTLVLPALPGLPPELVGPAGGVGLRMPDHHFTLELLRLAGPLPTTSANRSGSPSPTDASQAAADLGELVDVVADAGPCPGGVESSVLNLCGTHPRLLREGAVSRAQLEMVLGPLG